MSRTPRDRGEWVTLLGGVRVSRRWMDRHTPRLLADWCDAPSAEQRRAVAALILQVAAELESEPGDTDTVQALAEGIWRPVADQIDRRLTTGPDWPPLAAALTRAAATSYDPTSRLPALAATAPLPERHPARELHWRLLEDCPASILLLHDADGSAFSADDHRVTTTRPAVHRLAATPHRRATERHRQGSAQPVPKEISDDP